MVTGSENARVLLQDGRTMNRLLRWLSQCVGPWTGVGTAVERESAKFITDIRHTNQVVRGPAPLSLALAKRGEQDGTVVLAAWTETDFRDGNPPWWKP